jgi:predicted nucleotidyltransferase
MDRKTTQNDSHSVNSLLKDYFLNDNNVLFALVFGSYASGKQKKRSDIDVAVYFHKPPRGLDLLNLINTLSNICKADIDLVVLNTASAFLRHQVMKYGIALLIKDQDIYRHFREDVISRYDEYKFISGMAVYD